MIIVGHRGARGLAPENTYASFAKAVEHHADMLECDLRITHDDKVVLHHDPQLITPGGEKFAINEYTLAELQKLKPDLLSLEEFLSGYGDFSLYLEIKPGVAIEPIVKVLKKLRPAQYMIGSKSQKTLRQVRRSMPEADLIVIQPWSGVIATYRAHQIGSRHLAFNQRWLWSGFIKALSKRSYKVYAYTLNDPVKAKKWQQAGLYAVVTDYPDLFER